MSSATPANTSSDAQATDQAVMELAFGVMMGPTMDLLKKPAWKPKEEDQIDHEANKKDPFYYPKTPTLKF